MIPVRIAGTASLTPGRAVSTTELAGRIGSGTDAAAIEAKTGIAQRYFADEGARADVLGAETLRRALEAAHMAPEALDRIVYVSTLVDEMVFPATANRIAARLGLAGTCDCFDMNNACLGFLTAFDLAARGLATGQGPVGIVACELPSSFITPSDARPYVVFGDAVAAAVLDHGREGEGMLASWLRNDGVAAGDVSLANAAYSRRHETVRFSGTNRHMTDDAVGWVRRAAHEVLAAARLDVAEVEWVLPHQPNGALFAAILRDLGVDPARTVPVVHEIGSVGSVSIPFSLDRLMRSGRVRPGDRLLMVGVGAGISAGAILHQIPS